MNAEDFDDLYHRAWQSDSPELADQVTKAMNPQPTKNPNAVALGRLGGRAGRGACKARSTEQARAAVAVRWNKVKQQKQLNQSTL